MKRSPIKRCSAPKRRKPLRSTRPVRRVSRKRAARKFARNYGERGAAVRAMRCLVEREWPFIDHCSRKIDAAHVRARGMGGAKGDRRDLVPLCRRHHRASGEARTSQRAKFEKGYGIDLAAEAARIALELDDRGLA